MGKDCKYKVSTRCFTYNHSEYILDTMNGFVMQETNFPVVSCIVDDASTDKNQDIIRAFFETNFNVGDPEVAYQEETDYGTIMYAQHNTNKNCFFAILLLKENHYRQKRKKEPYLNRWAASSEYIAMCEGDDYWTDPTKLQKQVDYMDSHPECILSVHAAEWRMDDALFPGGCQESSPMSYTVEELIRCGGFYFATASFFFRVELENDWPRWGLKADVGDLPLQIQAGLRGEVHYLPDKMCVYRYQSRGSWSSKVQKPEVNIAFQKNKIEWMTLLDEDTGHKYQRAIYDQLFQHYNSLFNLREIGFGEYAKAVLKSGKKRYGRLLKDFCRFYLTPVYRVLKKFK